MQGGGFAQPGVGLLRVGDDEDFGAVGERGVAEFLCHRQQCGVGQRRIFAIDGHKQGNFAALRVKPALVTALR